MNTIEVAIQNVLRLGLDTAPIIYFIEEHPIYLPYISPIFAAISRAELAGVTSTITVAEVLIQPLRHDTPDLYQEYLDLFLHSDNFEVHVIDVAVAQAAADLRVRYSLRLPDALQLAVALQAGCTAFLTNDRQLRRVTDLRVLILDDLLS
jgi:predicted nucleic acid-binding protein